MRISTSKSEALTEAKGGLPTLGQGSEASQVEEFKYLGVLFMSEGKMDGVGQLRQ